MADTSMYIGPDSAPDRYRLLRSIGRGGEAVLYLAEIQLDGVSEPVVIKVFDAEATLTPAELAKVSARWGAQAELLRFVHRLGVVGVREHFEGLPAHRKGVAGTPPGRTLCLVMNYVEGVDLRDWRAEHTLVTPAERREAVRCLEQLAEVLDWLHAGKGTPSGRVVVHGDLSPGNVMVDANGQATLVDFGLSKLTADHRTAEVWFTPGFAAPEVFEGRRTPGTDRYAFGALAYFLLSGQSPAHTPEQLRGQFQNLAELSGLPAERQAELTAICATEPEKRPDSLARWVAGLRTAVISTTTAPSRPVADAVPPPPVTGPEDTPPAPAPPEPTEPPRPARAPSGDGHVPTRPTTAPAPPPPTQAPATQAPVAGAPGVPTPPSSSPPVATGPTALEPAARPPGTPAPPAQDPVPRVPTAQTPPAPAPRVPPPHGPHTAAASTRPAAPRPVPPSGAVPRKPRSRALSVTALLLAVAVLAGGGTYAAVRILDSDRDDTAVSQDGSPSPTPTPAPTGTPDAKNDTTPSPSGTEEGGTEEGGAEESGPDSASPSASASDQAPEAATDADELLLTSMEPVSTANMEQGSATVDTRTYEEALLASAGFCFVSANEYNLGRAWSTLRLTAGITDVSADGMPRKITLHGDGKLLTSKTLDLGTAEPMSVDVSGVLRLRIEVRSVDRDGCSDDVVTALADPVLEK
ncbi:protein kinase [Streptomyces sp. NPDC000351]|uniref:protein kinase domain-containing protein n=1 Tax=Streptomyces sp. NPDC000351 TaxID=3154250 RepID=UPI00333441A2